MTTASMQGKIILITGASSGIGRVIAQMMARSGAKIACCGRSMDKLEQTRSTLAGDGHASYLFDSSDLTSVEQMTETVVREMGPLAGVVHSAGTVTLQLLRDTNYARLQDMFQINYFVFVALAKSACRKGRYAASGMSVLAVSSLAGLSPDPGLSGYAASKAALNAAISALAKEYAPRGIRFNALCPSHVDTPMIEGIKSSVGEEAFAERVKKGMPLGLISPEDVAEAALFFLSDSSRKITGTHLIVNSGGSPLY